MRNGGEKSTGCTTFRSQPDRPQINIEFQDLSYSVPQGRKGSKLLLRGINGKFQSGQLTAILGPSGAGKSTLLNVLAGYKCTEATGSILINGKQRNIKQFGHLSRYIMQEDIMQPMLNVEEAMLVAANLKLDKNISESDKISAIDEILELLNLTKAKSTQTNMLSGGEKKRLSIALELLNNPPVLFLDEPTTGLDDLSCSQCIALLKKLAEGGRTVICSIHTPSARLFDLFDNVYIISSGQCVFQGYGRNLVPFLSNLGLECPKHFNPADFVIEVCSGEYGDHHDKMVTAIENGRCIWSDRKRISNGDIVPSTSTIEFDEITEMDDNVVYYLPCWTDQFRILLFRMWTQMWRDRSYLLLRTVLHILIGILNGNLYIGMGKDGSKTIFNYGFYFTCIIFFMYIPMMPVLLQFPKEIQLLRREHFNKWYCLSAYFTALTISTIPLQIILGTCYLSEVYILSDQPVEMNRIFYFFGICLLTGIISESLGLLIASNLSLLNAMFIGPVVTVPLMLLAVYGFGSGYDSIPGLIRFAMHLSYLRYSLEGIIIAMLEGREKLSCPNSEDFCIFTDLNYFIREMGMNNGKIWLDITALFITLILFRGGSYYLLRQRLTPNKTFLYLQYIGRFVKNQIGISR